MKKPDIEVIKQENMLLIPERYGLRLVDGGDYIGDFDALEVKKGTLRVVLNFKKETLKIYRTVGANMFSIVSQHKAMPEANMIADPDYFGFWLNCLIESAADLVDQSEDD